jgi:cobalt-zinc-cadmium efflux system membrane fusion protein
VTHRFEHTVFVRATPIPKEEQLTNEEAEEGLLPKEPLRPGERVLLSGSVELKAVELELESRPQTKPTDHVARGKTPSGLDPESQPKKSKAGKG